MFRMSRAKFEELTLLIEDYMPDINEDMAKLSSGSTITNRTKLHVTLRWLAGGSYLDLCFGWGISIPSFYEICIWPTIDAIDQTFQIGLPLDDLNELKRMADEFSLYSRGQLWGCVTAIDGWVARTRKPFNSEVADVMSYRNRHDCWGLVVLAGCDAHCRFTVFSCKNSGSIKKTVFYYILSAFMKPYLSKKIAKRDF